MNKSENVEWYSVIADTGTIGIVSTAALTLLYASKNALRGPPTLFIVNERDDETPITLTWRKAVLIPMLGSSMLLLLYVFFERIQFLYLLFNATVAGICLEMALRPLVIHVFGSCTPKSLKLPLFGVTTTTSLLSMVFATTLTMMWIITGNWILLNVLGVGLCSFMMAAVRLPNVRIAMFLFGGLLCYDIFWVFFSERFFTSNVMVDVATKTAVNPMQVLANSLSIHLKQELPSLSIPAKIMFPSYQHVGEYSLLGLGDIVLPGILIAHNLRYDKRVEESARNRSRRYFSYSMIGYCVGLVVAIVFSQTYHTAQPALIYLIPGTLGPTVIVGWLQGDLADLYYGLSLQKVDEPDSLIQHVS
eukprot:m.231760 g.231760  ORF g.231760 m.231760 type:complete len:361 (-) comp33609_c0_seq1:184-1266(-)